MRAPYDFSKAVKNPYAKLLKKQVTLRLDEKVLDYFKQLGAEKELPWQTLINLYLRDCAATKRKPKIQWHPESK